MYLFIQNRRGYLGRQHSGCMGIRDQQLRVVDWYWSCRYFYLCSAVVVTSTLARINQSLCGGNDIVRRWHRCHFSDSSFRAAMVFLLADPLSRCHEPVAAMAQ